MKNKFLSIILISGLFATPTLSLGQAPDLGTAANFALFTVDGALTNSGASTVIGDIGNNNGAYSGFNTATRVGQTRLPGSPEAAQAAADVTTAYNALTTTPCSTTPIGPLLGSGQVLTPGVYCQSTPAAASTLNGILTLSGAGVYIIKLNGALTTATGSIINLTNGACADNVYFQVNGAVDVGVGSVFRGTILANGAISLLTGSTLEGRALSVAGAISVNESTVTVTPSTLSLSVVAGSCDVATNNYVLSGTVSLTNSPAGTIVLTDGVVTTSVSVTAGQTTASFSLSGLDSGTGIRSVTATGLVCGPIATTYASPASCTAASLGGLVFSDTDGDGVQNGGESPIPGVDVTLLNSSNMPIASTTTGPSGVYSFTGLAPGTPYSVSFTTPANYTATGSNVGGIAGPVILTAGQNNTSLGASYQPIVNPTLSVESFVSQSTAVIGDVLTYSLVLTNSGSTPATITVRDSIGAGGTYVPNSATFPAGTSFTAGPLVNLWTVPAVGAGQSLTLTFQVSVDAGGILYNVATIPGDTAKVCTSIPIRMCVGDEYSLTAPAGRASYRWYRNDVLLADQTTNVLIVTEPGTYSLGVDNAGSSCPDFSCCPFILEMDNLPSYQAASVAVTCLGSNPQADGKLILSGFDPTHTYQYSLGATFDPAASLSGAPQVIPASGQIATTLTNPAVAQPYTVRVYNSSGCFTDVTVLLTPTVCTCPAPVCTPFVLTQTKRPARIGDPTR